MVSFLRCCLEEEIGEVLRMQIAVRLSVRPVTFAKVLVRSSHLQTNEIRRKFENDTCGQWKCGVHDANKTGINGRLDLPRKYDAFDN